MAHDRLPHILQNSGLHHSGIEGVPKVMEAQLADAGPSHGRLPGSFDPLDGTAFEGEGQAFGLVAFRGSKEVDESRGKRDLTGLPAGGF